VSPEEMKAEETEPRLCGGDEHWNFKNGSGRKEEKERNVKFSQQLMDRNRSKT
jgi:hypothetical protein